MTSFVVLLATLLACFSLSVADECNETSFLPDATNVQNMLTGEAQQEIWIEGGFVRAGDSEWVTISTILDTFTDAAVFVSLPEIAGATSSEGFPAISRIRNVVTTGRVSFEVILFQANDSFCLKTWYTPQPINPPVSLSWLVAERGVKNLSGSIFMIGDGPISRAVAAPYDISNRHTFMFPTGCESPDKSCEYPASSSDLGIILQLQTTVNERLLIPRVFSGTGLKKNNSVILILQTHDSLDPSYYEVPTPELLAYMTFVNFVAVSCIEGLSFETTKYSDVTNTKKDVNFQYTFTLPPGIYGTIGTAVSLADSTGLRAFDLSVTGASFITQEDQCVDEETIHTNKEVVYTFVVGERTTNGCTVCKAVFTPDTPEPTSRPTTLPSSSPSSEPTTPAPTTVCKDAIEVVRMRRF